MCQMINLEARGLVLSHWYDDQNKTEIAWNEYSSTFFGTLYVIIHSPTKKMEKSEEDTG